MLMSLQVAVVTRQFFVTVTRSCIISVRRALLIQLPANAVVECMNYINGPLSHIFEFVLYVSVPCSFCFSSHSVTPEFEHYVRIRRRKQYSYDVCRRSVCIYVQWISQCGKLGMHKKIGASRINRRHLR